MSRESGDSPGVDVGPYLHPTATTANASQVQNRDEEEIEDTGGGNNSVRATAHTPSRQDRSIDETFL